jgi:3-deoxy-D-manno-octulosonic-acid transferase
MARGLAERLGFLPYRQTASGAVWLHAVSVGEVLSSVELIRRLKAELPGVPVFLSTTTYAGRALAGEKLASLADGIFFSPVDTVFSVRRVLRALRPWVVIVAETEIWPNLFRESKRHGCGLIVVNGRISDRAAPRYLRWRWFFSPVLGLPDRILVQSEPIRKLYLELGAPAERVTAAGNLKYDFEPKPPSAGLLSLPPDARLWIAASTMPPAVEGDPDEDDVVIDAWRELSVRHPELRLLLVPRRPERFDSAARKLEAAGVEFARRSAISRWDGTPRVLLLDTIGELSGLFASGDVVFMGGTLASRGGHNVLEPAFFARPVVCGPHMENFRAVAEQFRARGACLEIGRPEDLAKAVDSLLSDPERSAELGRRGQECALENRGATARAVAEISRLYGDSLACFPPPLAIRAALWPPAAVWSMVSCRAPGTEGRLRAPVVSVGNLGMGGTGKTPIVAWLAERLRERGRSPAILTRGYRRRSRAALVLEAGARAPAVDTGDEAQLFLRAGCAPVGVGADRLATGRMLEEKFSPDVILLDDGFQHRRLARAVDIVLVDATDPFAGCGVFPIGRRREPLEALARADIFVVTRALRRMPSLERRLREFSAAPVFYARTVPLGWVRAQDGARWPLTGLPAGRTAAFCGLGNPESFWRSLAALDLRPEIRIAFRDHHRYTMNEIPAAKVLLTTAKDAMNLPAIPAGLHWLEIGIEMYGEDEFFAALELHLAAAR